MNKKLIVFITVLSLALIYVIYLYINNDKKTSIEKPLYHNQKFNVKLNYLSNWYGPEIYEYEDGFRFEVGTDKVYPYGTDRLDQNHTKKNNYFIVVQFYKKPSNAINENYKLNNYALKQYDLVSGISENKSITSAKSMLIKIRDISNNGLKGVEYISTLSTTAQTEPVYTREVVLFNENYDSLVVRGSPENVVGIEETNWRAVYEKIDRENNPIFEDLVNSIVF